MSHGSPLPSAAGPATQELADLQACAQEPIRVPGAIQPHGWLAIVGPDRRIVAWSENWPACTDAQAAVDRLELDPTRLVPGDAPAAIGRVHRGEQWLDALAHRCGEHTIVEFEPGAAQTGTGAPIYSLARHFLPQLQRSHSVQRLAELAALEIKRLTGFGRSLVYRFDADGHGEVLAECLDPGYDSYLGHFFPASDIPAQARALYLLNHIRLIPDAHYRPVALRSDAPGWDPRSVDLSLSGLRSVSPVHLEYMRNMGTIASMSVSIVVEGRLWGLISCHDHAPRSLPFEARAACEHLGRLLALQIEAKEHHAQVAARLELRKLTLEIVSHLADGDATLQRLLDEPAPLLRMAGATGAAVVLNGQCWTIGETPSAERIAVLAQWITARDENVMATDRLAAECPGAADWDDGIAGVLAVSISQVHQHMVLWFRPERIQTIRWAGEPQRKIGMLDGRVHPRKSFASWRQQVRGRSAPWTAVETAAAAELRHALIGIVLRRAEEIAEVAAELGRLNKELEAFSYTVSHDLRAPMRHIAGYVDLVLEADAKALSQRSQRYLGNVKQAAAYAGQLVDALLDFSRMGRAELKRGNVPTKLLVEELVAELNRQEAERRVEWEIDHKLPTLWADPFLMQVVLRNLLGNAVKYTRTRDVARIGVRALSRPDGEGLLITDNGVGFQQKYVGKLFGVFQRLHQAEEFEGTGIGLASVRRIVERHGGTVWAEGSVDQGATFGFVIPRAPLPQARPGQTSS